MVFLELSSSPLSPKCSPWVFGWSWFSSGMFAAGVALWGWLVVLGLFFKLLCTLNLLFCLVFHLLWPSFSWEGYVLDGLFSCIHENAKLLLVGLLLLGGIRSKKFIDHCEIGLSWESKVHEVLELGIFLLVGRSLEFWNFCDRARVRDVRILSFRIMEGLGGDPCQDSQGSYKKLLSALVVGMLASSMIAIWLLVGLGNEWISSPLCLVMASPAVAVKQILTEAPQLLTLREASSSIVLLFPFLVKQQFLELQMNATHRQRSQEGLILPSDDVNGERKFLAKCGSAILV